MEEDKKIAKETLSEATEKRKRGRPKKEGGNQTEKAVKTSKVKTTKKVKAIKKTKKRIGKSKETKNVEEVATEIDSYDEEQIIKVNFKGVVPTAELTVADASRREAGKIEAVTAAAPMVANAATELASAVNDEAVFEEKMNKADAVKKIIFDEIIKVDSKQTLPSTPAAVVAAPVSVAANVSAANVVKTDTNISGVFKMAKLDGNQAVIDEIKHKRSTKLYKKIAIFFSVVVFFVLIALYWFTFFEAKIVIVPRQDTETKNMIIDVSGSSASSTVGAALSGAVEKIKVVQSIAVEATGVEITGKEAVGKIKIVNNYIKDQPLVATTRLLSADGRLFRLKDAVTVPAGGEVVANIYADEPTAESAIGPTRFTIPGLWSGLQDKVYGESSEAIEYRQIAKKRVTQIDIDNGKQEASESILEEAKIKAKEKYPNFDRLLVEVDKVTISSVADKQVGDEAERFNIAISADATVVGFNEDQAFAKVNEKFVQSLDGGKGLEALSKNNVIYSLGTFNTTTGEASVNVNVEGQVSIKDGSEMINRVKKDVVGLNKVQIEAYLKARKEIMSFEVSFKPAYRKSIPKYIEPSKIKIEIRK